jgi:hypothetical protein
VCVLRVWYRPLTGVSDGVGEEGTEKGSVIVRQRMPPVFRAGSPAYPAERIEVMSESFWDERT